MSQQKERWASRIGLILAVAGNAVGLGNFLRFPAQAIDNGGGAFIIPYLISFALMGIPLLWVEWAIGRHGGQYGHHSTPGMLDVLGKSPLFKYFGVFGIFTNLVVAAYYCYIESWTLGYVWFSITGAFNGMNTDQVAQHFKNYLDSGQGNFLNLPGTAFIFFGITVTLNLWILSKGISAGIEKASKILMPLLLVFGVFLAIRALTLTEGTMGAQHDAIEGLNFLWTPNFNSLWDPKVWLAAAGQIFFTLSVGMGSIQCYAAYLRKKDDIALNSVSAGFTNEFVEVVLGGSVVIPIAVAYLGLASLTSFSGFGMSFMTLPNLFQYWGPVFSVIGGVVWFGLLFFAGITSSLAMGQPVMAFFQDSFNIPRKKSVFIFGALVIILAIPTIILYDHGAFDEFDFWAGTFSLVVFALAESIIFIWIFGIDKAWEEINRGADIKIPIFFKYVLKYVTPTFILIIFLGSLISPVGGEWSQAFSQLFSGNGWPLAPDSVIGKIFHIGVEDRDNIWVTNLTRMLLMSVYLLFGYLTYKAWKLKLKKEK
ncbi:MAG: sodium-dependent transporter [Ignavibacteriaceae bacterium]|nr:sodium-dependent transporter [Ignavibacteriaceae bacterium]